MVTFKNLQKRAARRYVIRLLTITNKLPHPFNLIFLCIWKYVNGHVCVQFGRTLVSRDLTSTGVLRLLSSCYPLASFWFIFIYLYIYIYLNLWLFFFLEFLSRIRISRYPDTIEFAAVRMKLRRSRLDGKPTTRGIETIHCYRLVAASSSLGELKLK